MFAIVRKFAFETAAFAASHFLKHLVMSPCVLTVGKGICAIAEHVMQCLGPTTGPAFCVFHSIQLGTPGMPPFWTEMSKY